MTQLNVRIADAAGGQSAVLATLPNRFRTDRGADVTVVAGDALPAGRNGAVMIADPGLASAADLDALAKSEHVIGLALVAAPALPAAALELLAGHHDDLASIVDAAAETPGSLRAALFELLMLLDSLGGRIDSLRILATSATEIVLGVEAGPWHGTRVSARRSFRTRFALETVSRTLRRRIVVDGDAISAPAEICLFDGQGTRIALPRYESGLRASWRALHERLTQSADDGEQVATAIRLLGQLDALGVSR